MIANDSHHPNLNHPDLCDGLRWKSQFTGVEHDPSVPACNDNYFWCTYTQTCVGPDGKIANPTNCCKTHRACHGGGVCS